MARTIDDLRQMQALPLSLKVSLTKSRIRQWVNEYGEDGVYVGFSGGKDSTVLLDIVRSMYPDIPAVFVNTGLEYPEIVQFVKTFDNVEIIRPEMNFKKVIEKYGYPFITKKIAMSLHQSRKYLRNLAEKQAKEKNEEVSTDLIAIAENTDKWEMPYRVSLLLGQYEAYWDKKRKGEMPKDGRQGTAQFSQERWKILLNAPFNVSHICCNIMKKNPLHKYQQRTGRRPMTAQMAEESQLRLHNWLENGCNGFQMKEPISNPLSFWTEQDVLKYIRENNLRIASVYGDIVADEAKSENVEGQLRMNLDGTIEETECVLKTTGCKRTGCMFCGFGCHLEKEGEGRFERMKETHPKLYEWIMKPWEDGGLGYKDVIDWLNENGGLNIRY